MNPKLLLPVLLLPVFFLPAEQPAATPKPVVSAQIIGWKKEKPAWSDNPENILLVKVTLRNSSPDTIWYASMKCDWQDVYSTTIKSLFILGTECNSNYPVYLSILPHTQRLVTLKCGSKSSPAQLRTVKFRIGFHYVPVESKKHSPFYYEDKFLYPDQPIKKNMLWSNELQL